MKKELVAETLGHCQYALSVHRVKRDASGRRAFIHHVYYEITVNGDVKHSGLNAEDTIVQLTATINSLTNAMGKAGVKVP